MPTKTNVTLEKEYKGIIVSTGYAESGSLASFKLAYTGTQKFKSAKEFAELFLSVLIDSYKSKDIDDLEEVIQEIISSNSSSGYSLLENIEPLGWKSYKFESGLWVYLSDLYWDSEKLLCNVQEQTIVFDHRKELKIQLKFLSQTKDDIKRQALAKLTNEEKLALGIK